jgi:hypothetical protein
MSLKILESLIRVFSFCQLLCSLFEDAFIFRYLWLAFPPITLLENPSPLQLMQAKLEKVKV